MLKKLAKNLVVIGDGAKY